MAVRRLSLLVSNTGQGLRAVTGLPDLLQILQVRVDFNEVVVAVFPAMTNLRDIQSKGRVRQAVRG